METRNGLTRYAWLSILAAIFTIGLKYGAYVLTNSVGFLSDALESVVNITAAIFALVVLTVAARPPDHEHAFGHSKVEYFSSAVEGLLILLAAGLVAYQAIGRLLRPEPLEDVAIGVLVSGLAALVNFAVSRVLLRAGASHRSATLTADGHHLMTDVWTSVGVIVAVGAVGLTGWLWLDPVIALVIAAQIVYTGVKLIRLAVDGLMDVALPEEEVAQIEAILRAHMSDDVSYHALRTRQSGAQRFVEFHVQVPGTWNVQAGHELLEQIEGEIRRALEPIAIFTHIEPAEDPRSFEDQALNRPVDD